MTSTVLLIIFGIFVVLAAVFARFDGLAWLAPKRTGRVSGVAQNFCDHNCKKHRRQLSVSRGSPATGGLSAVAFYQCGLAYDAARRPVWEPERRKNVGVVRTLLTPRVGRTTQVPVGFALIGHTEVEHGLFVPW